MQLAIVTGGSLFGVDFDPADPVSCIQSAADLSRALADNGVGITIILGSVDATIAAGREYVAPGHQEIT